MALDLDLRDHTQARASVDRVDELNALASSASSEAGLLGLSLPPFVINEVDPTTNNASVITFAAPAAPPAPPALPQFGPATPVTGAEQGLMAAGVPQDFVGRAVEVVGSIGAPLGLAPGQSSEFKPDLNIQATTSGAKAVHLEQHYKGIRIFQAAKAVRFGPDGELNALVGRTVTVDEERDATPKLSAQEAVVRAARLVAAPDDEDDEGSTDEFGTPVPRQAAVDLEDFEPRLLATFTNRPDQPMLFDSGPFHDQIRANLIWFPLALDDLRLAWEIVLRLPGAVEEYRVLVDAASGEGLYARQLVQSVRATADVYSFNGGQPRASMSMPLSLGAYGVPVPPGLPPAFPGDWVDADGTAGNSTLARYGDSDRILQGQSVDGAVNFSPSPQSQDQAVLNAFFLCCMLHDFFYLLGFREESGNFQRTNAGPGGAAGDRVDVRVYPGEVPRTASMLTPVDGTSPIMKLGLVSATGNHTAMDFTVVAHEFMHGVTNRLVGGPGNVNALDAPQCRGMGEGWGDYVACTIVGTSVIGAWLVNKPGGIRGFPYDRFPANTDNFGQLGQGRYTAEHNTGEIWCATLLEMNRRIGQTLGVQLVVDALKLSPANPSFLDMRDAILAALDFKGRAGQIAGAELPRLRDGIWQAFAKFGMGPRATSNGPFLAGVSPDFSVPGGAPQPVGLTDVEPVVARVATDPEPEDGKSRGKRSRRRAPSVAIPDAAPDGVSSTLTVADVGSLTAISVSVDVEHPATEELRITLRSPSGSAVVLHDQSPAGANLKRQYSLAETSALAPLVGEPAEGDWSLTVADLVEENEGLLRGWSLELELEQQAPPTPTSAPLEARPNVAIPDDDPNGVRSTIVVDERGVVGSIKVDVDVTHPVPADLVVELIAPSGLSAVLHQQGAAKEANLATSFESGSSEALAALAGEAMQGTWTLRVADVVRKDTGTLNRWSLSLEPVEPTVSGLTATISQPAPSASGSEHQLNVVLESPQGARDFFVAFSRWLETFTAAPRA